MIDIKRLKQVYATLQQGGYNQDFDTFKKGFTGNENYANRKQVYDLLSANGAQIGNTYEEFMQNMQKPKSVGNPTVNKYRQQMFNSVDPNKSRASELTHRAVGQAVRGMNNVRKPVTAKVVNQKGKPTGEEIAITPAKTVEDLDREYAQETTKNWENELHNQMADADKDAAKISDMFKSFIGSTDEVGSVWGNMTRGGGIAGTPHSVTTNNGILENTEARQLLAAGDYNRKRRELLQLEQDSRNGAIFDDHSFFRGMYDAAKDTGFLTGGASDLINAGSLLSTKQDLDNGVHTEAGDMLMQQAVKNSDAQSQYGDNQGWMYTGGVITTNMAPFMVQIGSAGFSKGMSNAIGKVVQGAASKVALGTMNKAIGLTSTHVANIIGKMTGLTTKAFGKAVQYGIVGAAQANTVGLGNVANDVVNRYTGQVYQDEQGNYKFGTFDSDGNLVHEGGEDFLTALVKGDAAQTIEFATELAGGGIDAVGTALKNFATKGGKKIIEKYNMENVSKVINFLLNNKVSKNARYLKAGADRTLGKVELNSIVGESLEEELGIIANTVFTGDNKISDLWDEKQQSQIWGGMLLSIGLMKGAVAPFHAYNSKQYYSYKHKLDKADVNLSQLLGKEKWEELRNQIDATTNEDMPEMVNKINRDVALGKNRQPVREYIQNLLIMRGYDIGNMLAAKKAVEDKGEGVSVKNMEKNQAYQQGRDAYGYDTHEIQLDQEDKQKNLAQVLGISEQQLASMSDEELDSLSGRDDNIDRAIYDYQLSSARYEGVVDNARDQIDLEVQRAAQAVDMYTDKSRNTIRNATIKATGGLEDYGVYIINGNIATHEDGSIDISNSDDMILYYDPTTNTVEHADATMFAELGSEENADEVRNQAMADAKEKAIKETTGIIDGVVEVGTQFKTVDADGAEHTYEVLADNGDGTAMITIDGNIPTEIVNGENVNVPVSFEELQKTKDESDQQRLQAAKAQREQMEKERAEQQTQAQTAQAENPAQESNTQSAPIEDNLDYSDIIREDGKVQMVDVSDKDGNNLFPDANDVFYIQGNKMRTKFAYIDANGELKTQSFPTGLIKIKTRGEVSVDDYKKYRNTILAAESSSMPETSMIEDNSGTIEVDDNTQPLSEADADNVIAQMESSAEVVPELELTPDNWAAEFGEDGIVSTPIGDVKMGENQVAKLFEKGRSKEFGMIKPTLTNPDVIIEVPSHSADGNEERSSSYLFIKTFLGKNGKKVYYFKSVTIKKDGLEISISSHYDRAKRVKEALMKGKLLYRKNDGAQTEQNQPSTSVTTSQEDAAGSSESKDTNISANSNENNESLTFEDGTPIPVDENGETDLSQTDAAHAAEWYDNNLGEDADDWLDGEIKKAKKVLEQAKNKKVTGTKPSELVASKKEKEAAIADAQAHYDSAISIRDAYNERQLAKVEDTAEGRKNLIDKARRKFARLKSAVKDDAEAVAQLYKETVGNLLHRLYDVTGIDVTDTIPLTAEEYVASNLGAHSLNYEGTETSKGVKQETGLSREDFAKTQLLAADGKGTTIDALVHSLWENRPSNLESLDTQDIRNALIGVLNSGFKASEARNFVENIRIAQAENILEEQKRAQENAAYAEQQKAEQEAELKAKSDEKAESEAKSEDNLDNESNDLSNESDNEKTNDNINDNINTPEVPEDATDENPLGLQLSEDKVPFEIEGGKSGETYDITDNEDRQRLINDNKVDDKDILDIDMPKHVHKAIKELCKKMGLKVQFLYMGARSNGWIENGTMYLALDTEKATQFVFGHEMTHAIKQKNPEAYKELVKVAMAVTTKKKFEEDLAKVKKDYKNIKSYRTEDDFIEEVVADNIGMFINKHDLAQKYALRLNHPVLATILHVLQEIKHLLPYGDLNKSVEDLERIVEKTYTDTANGSFADNTTDEDARFSLRLKSAIDETETNPSDAQKESGNYKKGHIKFGGYDYTIENPKGSTRSGKDADGKEWKVTMHDTYGYIRGKYGKDGDHLDMFINDKADLDNWNGDVFVVDQVNPDGSFDEHKVMYGFDSMDDAEKAYLANYSEGWQGLGNITGVSKDEFDKWLDTSNRKLKPFADYAKVKFSQAQSVAGEKRESLENGKSMDTATSSLGGDTALSQSKESAAKIDNSSETTKENGEKFSLKDEKTLAGVHNISEEKLLKAIKQGGLANPSVAVIDSSKQDHKAYGGISLIMPSDKIAKRTGKNAGTWQGDAYTPTYPQVERQMSNKGAEKASKDVSYVPSDMYSEVRRGLDRWLDGGEANSAMGYMFLHEKGVAPEPKKIQPKFSDEAYNELKFITAGDFNIYGIGKADAQKVLDMYIEAKFDGDKALYEEKTKAWLERNKAIVDAGTKGGMRYVIAKENVELYDEYGFNYKGVQSFVRDVEYDHRKTGVDTDATLNEVEDYIKTNNLTDEFNTWLEGKEKEYGIKEVIFDGFTPSGNRRYVPNTLENVSKLMKKQGRNGATGAAVSFQNFAARLMPSYGTLKDIRSKKDLLTSDREKFDKFRDKWSSVFFELGNKCQPDSTSAFDSYGMERLSEAAMTSDPQAYLKKEYNVDFSDEDTKRLKEMVKAIKEEHPAMYFETKFERPVRFDEFSAAVVPTTTKKEVKDALKNAGVSIFEYDEKSDADRKRAFNEAINSSDNIRFSLAGERGAAAADKAEERTIRMDNLSVARKMEEEKKDAKAIKMATGWERGADGKWRYEMPDAKIKDTMDVGGGHIVKRYEDDMLWNGGKLSKVIDAPELFKAYPQLKDVRIDTDAIMNDMPSNGEYNSKTNTITIHADELKYMNSILNHEIQHAIQEFEGFAKGGSPRLVRGDVKKKFNEVTKQIKQLRAEGKEDEAKALIEKNRGLYNAYQKNDDYNSYKSLAGEVEARNVSARLNMTPEERRKSLAESTEDVARKDQIFLGVGDAKFSLRGSTPYDKQMEEWMEKNHLEKGAVPMEKPIMGEGENIFDYANRMVEWTRNQNLWKTAPKQTGFQDALEKWKADNGLSSDAYPPVRPHRENYSTEIGYAEDLEEYNKKKELWKSAPKPKDFDLSVDLEDMNKQLRNIRRAVLNQKNYDQRTVKAVSDLVRKMLNIGWGDGLSRGKVGNLLSAAKNATGANDVKKYLDKAMGILAENYLNRLSTAYDNLINTKGARADQSGVIKMGSLDAKGQAFMSEYKKAINMDDKSLNTYIANIEEDSAKNEDNVEMNDYRLAGIQAAIMFKQQIGGNDADISELQRQIGELKNKKDATKEDKDLLKSLEKKLFENKFDRITMYENLLNNIQRMVKESKGRAKEFREELAEHKNEILHRANLDLEGVDSTYYDTTTAKKKFVNNVFQRAAFSSTYTFEQFLKFFGKKAANGEGYLYNYFTKLNQDALDEEQLYNEMNRNALDEKTKELFGKEKFMKLVGIDGNGMKEMDIDVTDYSNKKTGKRTIHLKQGQMLYIYLVNKETDGEMKLRAMGITEEDVAAIEENLDPRVKAMGEWLQDEYLPECQRRYQATHTKYFGAPMKEVENYFPLAINNRARNVKEDVNQDSDAMSQLAGTSTGAIVTRRVNVIPLDIENADAFEVAFNHLQEMEEWSAMLPFRQDVNTLLSYTHFRNQVQNMSSVAYGSGKTLWDEFKQTAQIAAGTYKPKVNAGMMDSRIAAAMGGIAVAKISGRLWTAIKQSQSATVFLPECDFTRFVKNGVNLYGSWKWAMENIPDFRKRVENMTYGDVKLRQYLDELEKLHDWTKTISKIGMAPNILVDGITCAVGARSVYETEVNRLTKLGYPKEKAEEKAYYKAVAAYNKTQQSSGGMYLSPMQVDRTYVSAALSLFKNANYAYGRMQIEACRGLARTYDFWGGKHKTALIESMTRQIMEEDGLDENTARAITKATYNRTFRQSIGRLINFATLVPISWALYKVLPYLLTGDDDDKKTDMIEEGVLKGFATSLSDNYVIPFASNILNAGLKVEDGKPTFDPEVFRYQNLYINPATSDLANIYSMIGNQKWYSVANKLGMLGVQSLIGFNPETVGALYQAFAEADYDNGNTAKEWQIGILKAISAPEESIRELYMDELGLKSGDIKKIPLAELEKRYAERQINRDNLLSQIGMDAETFNGYIDKYQKSFEKKIKDKMDKWDEYDKKKADEFFDTTSDPKLKDMIAKKRTKDANAAADEQIAKEGLNQEKKGKEPSEEAYDAVKMSIDVAEDNAISTYNKVLNKRYAALNDEYNNQTDAMKYIFMSKHPNFKAYKDIESEYTNYGKKMKELKEKLVSAKGYDAKQTILKQIRAEREKFSELQSKVR